MTKRKLFEDPLEDIDPVMQQAFSDHDYSDIEESSSPVSPAAHLGSKTVSEPVADSTPTPVDPPPAPVEDQPEIADIQFPELTNEPSGRRVELDMFGNIPVSVSVELGRSQISLKEVFDLCEGSIIELERLVGEPLDLVVSGQVVAQGEVVAIDNNYGLRVTNVVSAPPSSY